MTNSFLMDKNNCHCQDNRGKIWSEAKIVKVSLIISLRPWKYNANLLKGFSPHVLLPNSTGTWHGCSVMCYESQTVDCQCTWELCSAEWRVFICNTIPKYASRVTRQWKFFCGPTFIIVYSKFKKTIKQKRTQR